MGWGRRGPAPARPHAPERPLGGLQGGRAAPPLNPPARMRERMTAGRGAPSGPPPSPRADGWCVRGWDRPSGGREGGKGHGSWHERGPSAAPRQATCPPPRPAAEARVHPPPPPTPLHEIGRRRLLWRCPTGLGLVPLPDLPGRLPPHARRPLGVSGRGLGAAAAALPPSTRSSPTKSPHRHPQGTLGRGGGVQRWRERSKGVPPHPPHRAAERGNPLLVFSPQNATAAAAASRGGHGKGGGGGWELWQPLCRRQVGLPLYAGEEAGTGRRAAGCAWWPDLLDPPHPPTTPALSHAAVAFRDDSCLAAPSPRSDVMSTSGGDAARGGGNRRQGLVGDAPLPAPVPMVAGPSRGGDSMLEGTGPYRRSKGGGAMRRCCATGRAGRPICGRRGRGGGEDSRRNVWR